MPDRDREYLQYLQSMSLDDKFQRTLGLIGEWYNYHDRQVCVSLSGGKDSTVLADICAKWCSMIDEPLNLCFSNTGLEYPEIQRHVRSLKGYFETKYGIKVNLTIVTPKMRFDEVVTKYGYPIIGKEVAEAIYYARRLRASERERERGSGANCEAEENGVIGKQTDWKRLEIGGAESHLIQTSTARNRRTILQGKWEARQQSAEPISAERDLHTENSSETNRGGKKTDRHRNDFEGKWQTARRAGVTENGKTSAGGVFSNGAEKYGEKSLFNKEKWLPLCRDTPFMISHYCCSVMKKSPMKKYQRQTGYKPFLGTLAEESRLRTQAWIRHGCNAFESKDQTSQPLSFWTEQDVLRYTFENDLPLASVYGDIVAVDENGNEYPPDGLLGGCGQLKCSGCQRTGCIFCGFGAHLEKGDDKRFLKLAQTHPRQYEYCIKGGQWADNPHYDPTAPKMDGEWQNWNPKKIWVPSKQGLGMGKVFDMCNEIYGKEFIEYE